MYDLIKLVHVAAIALWIGNMAWVAFTLNAQRSPLLRQRLRQMMGVGISLTWLSGLYLVYASGYYIAHWFWVKFLVVVGLSALHGVVVKSLKSSTQKNSPTDNSTAQEAAASVPLIGGFIVAGVMLVAYLVVVKPF